MAGRLPRLPGVVATVDTSNQGGFFGGMVTYATATAQEPVAVSDQVLVHMFILPFRAVVTKIATETSTAVAAALYSVGIYNVDGTTLLIDSGTYDGSTTGVKQNSITSVTLEPGPYLFAQTANTSTTLVTRSFNMGFIAAVANGTDIVNSALTANASSAGVLPATTGTLTRNSGRQIVVAFFAP